MLRKNAELIVGGVQPNPYFATVSGFIGDIANIEMGEFYTSDLSYLWAGYMHQDALLYDSVLLEFLYDIYSKD